MEIILKENVANVGFKDEIVTVKAGYGRNFLIPTGKAVLATDSAKKVLAEYNLQIGNYNEAYQYYGEIYKSTISQDIEAYISTLSLSRTLHYEKVADQ